MQQKIQSIIEINNHKLKQCVSLIDNFPYLDLNLNVEKPDPNEHVLFNLIDRYEYTTEGAFLLKDVILNNLKQELIFSNAQETALLKQILSNQGAYSPKNQDEIFAAKNLILRLLCSKSIANNRLVLHIDTEIAERMQSLLKENEYLVQHARFLTYLRNQDALLYYIGFIPLYLMVEHFIQDFQSFGKSEEYYYSFILRYIHTHYKSILMDNNTMIVVHDGWSNLIDLNTHFAENDSFSVDMTEDLFEIASKNILPNEIIANNNFIRSIHPSLHNHGKAEDVAYSARLLIKQGLSLDLVENTLRPLFIGTLSPVQKNALQNLYANTTRWISLNSQNMN